MLQPGPQAIEAVVSRFKSIFKRPDVTNMVDKDVKDSKAQPGNSTCLGRVERTEVAWSQVCLREARSFVCVMRKVPIRFTTVE